MVSNDNISYDPLVSRMSVNEFGTRENFPDKICDCTKCLKNDVYFTSYKKSQDAML